MPAVASPTGQILYALSVAALLVGLIYGIATR